MNEHLCLWFVNCAAYNLSSFSLFTLCDFILCLAIDVIDFVAIVIVDFVVVQNVARSQIDAAKYVLVKQTVAER